MSEFLRSFLTVAIFAGYAVVLVGGLLFLGSFLRPTRPTSQKYIAYESGVSPKTISDWRYRSAPSLANFEAALNALGYQLKIVERQP
jgi:NADH:ubiquinone oxidoreductase subunit 3 (subunit A)